MHRFFQMLCQEFCPTADAIPAIQSLYITVNRVLAKVQFFGNLLLTVAVQKVLQRLLQTAGEFKIGSGYKETNTQFCPSPGTAAGNSAFSRSVGATERYGVFAAAVTSCAESVKTGTRFASVSQTYSKQRSALREVTACLEPKWDLTSRITANCIASDRSRRAFRVSASNWPSWICR